MSFIKITEASKRFVLGTIVERYGIFSIDILAETSSGRVRGIFSRVTVTKLLVKGDNIDYEK